MRPELPARGEVWWAQLPGAGRRPIVVLSRDAAIRGRRRAMIAGCSTVPRGLPSEVSLDPDVDPVPLMCVVQLDAVTDVAARELTQRLGRLSAARMREVCAALAVALDCS